MTRKPYRFPNIILLSYDIPAFPIRRLFFPFPADGLPLFSK